MSHLKALETQLKLAGAGDSVAAEVSLARGLASLLDSTPDLEWAHREYRFVLRELREILDDGFDAGFAELADRLGRAPVRDSEV